MVRGFSEDFTNFELNDGTKVKIKDNVTADTYFMVMEEWIKVETTTVENMMQQFKKDKAELEVVKLIFDCYTDVPYKKLSKKQDYNELSSTAGEIFIFLGKSTNSKENLKLKKRSQDIAEQNLKKETKEDS